MGLTFPWGLEGTSGYLQCVYYCWPFPAHHKPLAGEAPSLHPALVMRCPVSSIERSPACKEGAWALWLLSCSAGCCKVLGKASVQKFLINFCQSVHLALVWWWERHSNRSNRLSPSFWKVQAFRLWLHFGSQVYCMFGHCLFIRGFTATLPETLLQQDSYQKPVLKTCRWRCC